MLIIKGVGDLGSGTPESRSWIRNKSFPIHNTFNFHYSLYHDNRTTTAAQGCESALIFADPDTTVFLNADPDPDAHPAFYNS